MGEQPSTTKEDWDLKYHDCLTCQVICVYKQVVKIMQQSNYKINKKIVFDKLNFP